MVKQLECHDAEQDVGHAVLPRTLQESALKDQDESLSSGFGSEV